MYVGVVDANVPLIIASPTSQCLGFVEPHAPFASPRSSLGHGSKYGLQIIVVPGMMLAQGEVYLSQSVMIQNTQALLV